jgi:hypothetical protein
LPLPPADVVFLFEEKVLRLRLRLPRWGKDKLVVPAAAGKAATLDFDGRPDPHASETARTAGGSAA